MKYYVTFGTINCIIQTGNILAACVKAYKLYFNTKELPKSLPIFFRVSQRGFDKHDDDELISVAEIIKLITMSNKAKLDLTKLQLSQKKQED